MPPKRILDPNDPFSQRTKKCWWRTGQHGSYLTCKPFQRADLLADVRALTGKEKRIAPGRPWKQQPTRAKVEEAADHVRDAMIRDGRDGLEQIHRLPGHSLLPTRRTLPSSPPESDGEDLVLNV